MKNLLVFLLVTASLHAFSAKKDWHADPQPWVVHESKPDEHLKNNQAVFELKFFLSTTGKTKNPIKLSYNGRQKTITPDANGQYNLSVTPGKFKFQFWYNKEYHEIYTDSIAIEPAHRTRVDIHFRSSTNHTLCRKPVIYLYPQDTTEVSIQLKTFNPFTFTYPAYDSLTGWKVKAHPDGKIEQDGKTYQYLFWEGEAAIETHPFQRQGFVITRNELTSFFEEKLLHIGLNDREIQDFITYWVPEMQQHEKIYLYFMFNEEYDRHAQLTVNPKPDQCIRVMMLWEPYQPQPSYSEIRPQELPHFERKGFTLVEWGGAKIKYLMKCKF